MCIQFEYDYKQLGLNQSTTKDITIHQSKYKFDTIDRTSQFKAGLPVTFTVNLQIIYLFFVTVNYEIAVL